MKIFIYFVNNLGNIQYLIPIYIGFIIIIIGFLFKISAAPLHNWAPDVYDGTPTIVTIFITTIPKISIFVFILVIQINLLTNNNINIDFINIDIITYFNINIWKNLILFCSILSLIIGTVLGLCQYRIKRLLAYSTISHVGFILLSLCINNNESIQSFLFYLIQYSITNVCIFLTLLAFSYQQINQINNINKNYNDIEFISDLKYINNPLLTFSFSICLFSIAGIPPLIGFFAKQIVLYNAIYVQYYFISIIAVLCSVISASYYLKIIKIIYFTSDNININNLSNNNICIISNIHSLSITLLTIIIILFILQPQILLNSTHLLALIIFNS